MTTLAAGSSATVSIPAGQVLNIAAGGYGLITQGPGTSLGVPTSFGPGPTSFGPYATAQSVYLTATSALTYTVDGAQSPLLVTPAQAATIQSLVSGYGVSTDQIKQLYRAGGVAGTVIATGGDGIGVAGGWAVANGTLSTVTDATRPGRTILRATGTPGAGASNMVLRRKIASTALTGKLEATIKFPQVSAGVAALWIGFSATAPAADPPTAAPANNRQMYLPITEIGPGVWQTISAHPSSNRFATGNIPGRAWGSVETLPSVIQYLELQIQFDASVPDAERILDVDEVLINGATKPLVVVGFDGAGSYPNINSFALPLFKAAGVLGYMSGSASVMQTNAARCGELYAAGWDLIHQALRSTNNYATTPKNLWSEIFQAAAIMKANGWDRSRMREIMTMPSNARSVTTDAAAVAAGITCVGATGGLFPQSKVPVSGLLAVGRMSLNGTTAAQNQAMLDAAILEGSHIWYFGHDLVTTVTDGTTQMLQSEFAAFFAYLVAKAQAGLCEIVTPTEFLRRVGNA